MTRFKYLILIIVILIGLSVRLYRLDDNPIGFFADEAAIGFNAYRLLINGADEYGVQFPFFFRSFGDYRLPIPIYSNLPSILIFDLNEFSVRLTAAVFGTLTILLVFLLAQRLFGNFLVSICSAFFLAISPWHIHFSRFGSEYIYFPFWFTLSLYLLLKSSEKKYLLLLSFFTFGVTLYTYYPAIFIVPIFLFFLIVIHFPNLKQLKSNLLLSIVIFLLTLTPFFIGILEGTILTRWNKVSVFTHQDTSNLSRVISAYTAHFSPEFLFLKGDIDYPGHFINRFSIKGFGELYIIQLALIIFGIVYLVTNKKYLQSSLILILWLLLYPLGSTVTATDGGGPFAFRSIFGVIPFQILSGLGVLFVANFPKKARILSLIIILLITMASFISYLNKYHYQYSLYSSDFWGWQFGPRDIMKYFLKNKDYYDDLYLMGSFNSPEIFLKFYDPTNLCQSKCQIGTLANYNPNKRQLYAIGSDKLKELGDTYQLDIKYIIYYPNQLPSFYIGTLSQK